MRKFRAACVIVLAIGSGNAWAARVTESLDVAVGSDLQIGVGSPTGSAQFSYEGSFYSISPTAAIVTDGPYFNAPQPYGYILPLPAGYDVGPTLAPIDGDYAAFTVGVGLNDTVDLGNALIGLSFDIANGPTLYGYVTEVNYVLVSVTYDDSGAPVAVPGGVPVPEPDTLAIIGAAFMMLGVGHKFRKPASSTEV